MLTAEESHLPDLVEGDRKNYLPSDAISTKLFSARKEFSSFAKEVLVSCLSMNCFCHNQHKAKAWKHAAPYMGAVVGYRPYSGLCAAFGVVGTVVGRATPSLPRGKGDQGQIVGAIQITPIKPIPSDEMVRVEGFQVCI
jgi:hypothetical protein